MNTGSDRRRIAVIGGGISGLAAAYELSRARRAGAPIEEFLFEASPRLGGVIQTERQDGFILEGGPDSFLTEKPDAAELARELGLGSALVGSNDRERQTYILHRERLVPLPDGMMLMVPTRLWPALTTPLISFTGKLAVARERFQRTQPALRRDEDETVASFVRRHFGQEVLENIADPLLAGVYGGDSEALSAPATLPRFWEMEQKHGSLVKAALEARRRRRASGQGSAGSHPLFTTLQGGLEELVQRVAQELEPSKVLLGRKVAALERTQDGGGRYLVRLEGEEPYPAEAVILALPAHEVVRLARRLEPAIEGLEAVPYSSAVTVSLAYAQKDPLPPGFGFLAPKKEGRRMLACTFVHAKFPGRAPEGRALLRCFFGGARDPAVASLDDAELVDIAREELRAILSLRASPLFARVFRSPRAMPQYTVGHSARIRQIQERLRPERGLFLAGNAYAGIGIPDCIRSGREAARRAVEVVCSDQPAAESGARAGG